MRLPVSAPLAAALLMLAGTPQLQAQPAPDPLFEERMQTAPRGADAPLRMEWYSPVETVAAGPAIPLPTALDEPGIDAEALRVASGWAQARDSVALLVWHNGALRFERYWRGFEPDDISDTASMHKTVLALLYGVALRDGLIDSLDQPASDYLTEWAQPDDPRQAITIRHLLWMASGLSRPSFTPPEMAAMRLYLGSDINPVALGQTVVDEPGTIFDYANVSSQLLGIILRRAVREERPEMRYADYLSEALWSKLGTGPGRVWLDSEGGMPRTYCCLQVSPRDWLRIGLLFLNEGRVDGTQVVPAEYIEAMTTPNPTNPNFGLHVWMGTEFVAQRRYARAVEMTIPSREPFAAEDVVFLDGAGGQRVYIVPSHNLVIVRVGAAVAAEDWDDTFLPNTIIRGLP